MTFAALADNLYEAWKSKPLIRSINFHNTARSNAEVFDRQLEHCARHFSTVSEDELDAYLATGEWHKSRPGMLLAFYEGYRNNYDIILPLLEKHGLIGWFFVITGFVDCPVAEQLDYVEPHGIDMVSREYADGRYAMTWEELRRIDDRHVVASHARSHLRIAPMSPAERRAEIVGSQESFVRNLGHPVSTFVSRGGPAHGDHTVSDVLIAEAGYQFVISNYRIQRLRSKDSPD